ncbi:MAG: BatA domain-containing protein [candidate division WOR-3 bacterium]
MIFLKPLLLLLLPFSLIPLVIHLLLQLRITKILYPWVFIFEKEKEIRKKRKIKDILVLILRILVIFFVILSFSEPIIKSKYGIFDHIVYFEHPFYKKKLKDYNVKKIPFSKIDSLLNDKKVKNIYFLGPLPDTALIKLSILEDKRIYLIGEKKVKNIKIKDIIDDYEGMYIVISSDFDTSNIPLEIYHERDMILREELNIKKGDNLFRFNLTSDWNPVFIKIDVKDDYPDDNEKFFYVKKNKGAKIKIIGNNKYITAFSEAMKKGEEEVFIVIGIKDIKLIEKLISENKNLIIFPDTLIDELKLLLKKKGIILGGKLNNVTSLNQKIYFKKFFVISGDKNFKIKDFNYNIFSLTHNLCLAGFYPDENYTNFVYYPDFATLLYEVVNFFVTKKFSIPESSFLVLNLDEDKYSLYTSKEEKIFDYEGREIFLKPLSRGIYYLRGKNKEIILEVNPPSLPSISEINELSSNFIFIKDKKELFSINLKKNFLFISIFLFLLEVFLCLI